MLRIGQGYDIHRLVPGRPLVVGGVAIPYAKGLLGHSDADVLVHAACDALLGAAGMGDIGELFPDTDPQYRDANSIELLRTVGQRIGRKGWQVTNLDATIIAQAPKMSAYKTIMAQRLAECLAVDRRRINIKAKTTEGVGAIGNEEAMAAVCIVMLESTSTPIEE